MGRDSGAVCCGRLPPDDVVYFDDFRLARVDTELLKNRHEARAERVELLLSVPNLADLEVVARAEANLVIQPVRGHDTISSEPADGTVVLISGQRRWRKANEHTQGCSSRLRVSLDSTPTSARDRTRQPEASAPRRSRHISSVPRPRPE